MASLQRSFEYYGDAGHPAAGQFILEIYLPEYSYFAIKEGITHISEGLSRQMAGTRRWSVSLHLRQEEYFVDLPPSLIIGDSPQSRYGFFMYHSVGKLRSESVGDFVSRIRYTYKDEHGNEIGEREFDAIYGYRATPGAKARNYRSERNEFLKRYGTLNDINAEQLERLTENEAGKIFLINKAAYEALLEQVNSITNERDNNLYLLYLIEGLVDLSEREPRLLAEIDRSRLQWLYSILSESGIENHGEVLKLVTSGFDSLFDFPIAVPEVTTVEVRGNFTVVSGDEVSRSDLGFYDLIVEYAQKDGSFKVIRYNWDTNDNDITDNEIPFSFPDTPPIVLNSIASNISVKVKGFDGSLIWHKEYDPLDPELQALEIEVRLYRPDAIGGTPATERQGKRLRGKVIQFENKYDLNELTVVIQAKKEGDDILRIVGAAKTDKSGNFSLDYPYGMYTEAQALVSLMPNSPADIETDANSTTNEAISDDFIYLLLKENEVVEPEEDEEESKHKDKECDCKSPTKAKRLPDQVDLIASDEYTQDIGGTCLNLSTPNRTLREYSYNAIVRITDPDVANYVLRKNIEGDNVTYDLEGGSRKIDRGIVDLNNPIRWEDAPEAKSDLSFYQAVTVATGHILYYKSVFKADGYSLGDLVYSLPLAPGQKKQIVVFESSHTLRGAEAQSLSQREQLSAELLSDRFITDQLSGGVSEDIGGRSSASTAGISAGLGAGGSFGGIGGSLGVAGGYSNASSSASQNSSRNVSQFFDEKLRQSIMQNAESFRQLNASVVTTVTQGQE